MKTITRLSIILIYLLPVNNISKGSIINIDSSKAFSEVLKKKEKEKLIIPTNATIRCIIEDGNGNIWIGTEGNGVLKYDGESFRKYTTKDGLSSNNIWTIQQDKLGNLWFGTDKGINFYNGLFFVDYTHKSTAEYKKAFCSYKDRDGNLWFGTTGGVYKVSAAKIEYIALKNNVKELKNEDFGYAVFSILQDKKGMFWFGTASKGVCKYNGKDFSYITEKGLTKGAVRSILEDRNGIFWFGSNGAGLFSYNGTTLRNFSLEKGLENNEAVVYKEKTLARIWSITEDQFGKLWIGTVDAGVWTIDQKVIRNYNKADGLNSVNVPVIYKDKKNKLWFGGGMGNIYEMGIQKFKEIFRKDNC